MCIFRSQLASFSRKTSFNIPARGHILTGQNEVCIFRLPLASFSGKTSFNIPARGHILTGQNDGDLHEHVSGRRRITRCLWGYRSRNVGMPPDLDYQVVVL